MPTGFWTIEKLNQSWYFTKWFLKEHQMWFMLATAIFLAGSLIAAILNFVTREHDGDDDDDEYEYRNI